MKKMSLVTLSLMLITANAFASNLRTNGRTPYETLEALYQQARPARLSDFPTVDETLGTGARYLIGLSQNVSPKTTVEQLEVSSGWAIARAQFKEVVRAATPGAGPIFPGTPEEDRTITALIWVNLSQTPKDVDLNAMATVYSNAHYTLIDTGPEFAASFDQNDARYSESYRVIDDTIIVKSVATTTSGGQSTSAITYNYYWYQHK